MSNLLMDVHRRRSRWNKPQTSPPPPPTTAATTPSSSKSSKSTDTSDDHTFSHNYSTADTVLNADYTQSYRKDDEEQRFNNTIGDSEEFANILSLSLRKPQHWKWELTTSKSCSSIALPRILLYDHKGKLLVDVQDDKDSVYRQEDYEKPKRARSKKRSHQPKKHETQHLKRSASTNLTHSVRKALEREFNGLQIEEATPSPEPYSPLSNHSHHSRKAINFNTTDLPDYGLSRKSSSLRGVRFIVEEDDEACHQSQIPEFLPTPPSTTTPTSSSSGPQEKRKYRRSHSSGRSSALSESILERLSYQKGRFSSPEYAEEQEVQHSPRYFLRTSRAGTLVVQADSFSHHPQRRKRPLRNRSAESLQSIQKSTSFSRSLSQKQQSSSNSPTPSDIHINIKHQPIRCSTTEENNLLNKQKLTSEEDEAAAGVGQKQLMDNVNLKHINKYTSAHNQTKDLDYPAALRRNGKIR